MHANELAFLRDQRGIVLPRGAFWTDEAGAYASDAQPQLSTTSPSAGVPFFLTNLVDPKVIATLVAPMKAIKVMGGETKKGDWTKVSAQFPIAEYTGQVTSYGDYNNDGNAGANFNWVPRQSYHFQTIVRWGEREADLYGEAAINYAAELQNAAALIFAKFFNTVYFYGVSGLQNYGLLNDPSLPATIAPTTKAAGGTLWMTSGGTPNATANEVVNDVQALFFQLVKQAGGLVDVSSDLKMTLVLPAPQSVAFMTTNTYNVKAGEVIKELFPNLRIETAPEYATQGGNLVQLFVDEYEGVRTAEPAFTEKLRVHTTIPDVSSWKQKRTGGAWGAIIRRPILVAQMLGV